MARVPAAPRPGSVAILSGNLLMPAIRDATSTILAELKAQGWQTAIDPGWPPQGCTASLHDMFAEWLSLTDHALFNEEEVAALSRGAGNGRAGGGPAVGRPPLVVKLGPAGAMAIRDGVRHAVPAPQVEGDRYGRARATASMPPILRQACQARPLAIALARSVEVASYAVSTFPRRYSALTCGGAERDSAPRMKVANEPETAFIPAHDPSPFAIRPKSCPQRRTIISPRSMPSSARPWNMAMARSPGRCW